MQSSVDTQLSKVWLIVLGRTGRNVTSYLLLENGVNGLPAGTDVDRDRFGNSVAWLYPDPSLGTRTLAISADQLFGGRGAVHLIDVRAVLSSPSPSVSPSPTPSVSPTPSTTPSPSPTPIPYTGPAAPIHWRRPMASSGELEAGGLGVLAGSGLLAQSNGVAAGLILNASSGFADRIVFANSGEFWDIFCSPSAFIVLHSYTALHYIALHCIVA